MTNTIAVQEWVTSGSARGSSYRPMYELLRKEAPADEVDALFQELIKIRGAHRVAVSRSHGDYVDGAYVESRWFSISFRGTDRAVNGAKNMLMESGLREVDKNADHDHEACIARAREMGVPAWSAHTPETYLSQ